MLNYLTLIFICQLAGELIAKAASLPLPGPVLGMVLLFCFLSCFRYFQKESKNMDASGIPIELAKVGDFLLSHLSLLFVPAGVGVMVHFSLLQADWIALSAALVGSTIFTIAVTAGLMVLLNRRSRAVDNQGEPK